MYPSSSFRRILAPALALALMLSLALPASAFFWNKKSTVPDLPDFSKNGMFGSVISFSREDFTPSEKNADPAKLAARYADENADPVNAAKGGYLDNIIEPQFVKQYLIASLQMLIG